MRNEPFVIRIFDKPLIVYFVKKEDNTTGIDQSIICFDGDNNILYNQIKELLMKIDSLYLLSIIKINTIGGYEIQNVDFLYDKIINNFQITRISNLSEKDAINILLIQLGS